METNIHQIDNTSLLKYYKLFYKFFSISLQLFGLTPADYERKSIEKLAGMEVE